MASTTTTKPSISAGLHAIWAEIEKVLTAATGPLLILSAMVGAADIFSHGALTLQAAWLPLAWAAARAVAVTIWLGVACDQFLEARHRGDSGVGWFSLAAILFFVDLQTTILFGAGYEHVANMGDLTPLNLSPLGWLMETALLTVLLIPMHRAIEFNRTHTARSAVAPVAPVAPEPPIMFSAPPVAARAFYYPSAQPSMPSASQVTSYPNYPADAIPMESFGAPAPATRPRRSDSGHGSAEKARRVALLVAWLRDDPGMSITDCEAALELQGFQVSRSTVTSDRREALVRLGQSSSVGASES